MASSKKSSTKAKSKEAGTSKPAPQTNNHDSKKKKEKISSNKHANNASARAISDPGSASDDADELRAETTSKRAKASNSKIVKRNHGKKAVNGYAEEEEEEEVVAEEKISKFPMHRIKKIMKDENSDLRINQEALFIVNKATEMFLLQFCKDAYACCAQDRKKSLAYKHLSSVVYKRKRYDFLSDFVPEKLKFEDALKERSTEEPEKD